MRTLIPLLLLACAEPPGPATVPGAEHLALSPDPGPPPHEAPPIATLWARQGTLWAAVDRVQAVAPGDVARVQADGRLVMGGKVVADQVLPDLKVAADGTLFFTRLDRPATDVWRVRADGTSEPVTRDGRSDRPFPLPDGRLLWVSGAGGLVGFVVDGRRLTNTPGQSFVPVPAFPDQTRMEGERVVYHAGEAEWWLNPTTGEAGRR